MSVFAVTAQTRAAAHRCGASPEVWCAVHALHITRANVVVETSTARKGGVITGISDDGFTVGGLPEISWPEALNVMEVGR